VSPGPIPTPRAAMPDRTPTSESARDRRSVLRRRLLELEHELARAQADFYALAAGERVPGLHLVVSAAGFRALLPAGPVHEIVRLVAFDPLPDTGPHVTGVFAFRGRPVLALDVASALGVSREPPLDAQILVLHGARQVGLVVDRVEALVDSPLLVDEGASDDDAGNGDAWRRSGFTVGLCQTDGGLLPLLGVGACLHAAGGLA
jgi:chemotaxis signal transduction protein